MSTGLPREILKWLQSLDLSYSVKNPRRDFSNGFLVAEIFSRYFQYDIQLHSFDNGSSLKKKLDNWHLLEKFFKKRTVIIDRELIDGCIHNKDGSALELVEFIYSALTSRNVATLKANIGNEATPGYAKATTSNLIKENIKDSEVKVSEILATQAKAAQIVEEHTEILKAARKADILAGAGDKRHERIETRKVGSHDSDGPQMQFNEVKVKAVDKSISQLRANLDQTSAPRSVTNSRMSGTTNNQEGSTSGATSAPVKPIMETLSQALMNKLRGNEVARTLEGHKESFVVFVEERMATVPADVVTAVFQDLQTKCMSMVVNTIHQSPREFWRLLSTLLPALAANHAEGRGAALGGFLCAIGMKAVEKDPRGTWEMFVDFGLTKAASFLKKSHSTRAAMLQVVYSFCPNEVAPHIAAIKAIQDALGDQQTFMHCLSVLVTLESAFNEDMLDLYLYYCVIGLGMSSQHLRAACLSILPIAAIQNPELVLSKLDLLEQTSQADWWEVHAQCMVIYATLLDTMEPNNPQIEQVYSLLHKAVARCSNQDVLKIALCHLAPCLDMHPSLNQLYAQMLFDIPSVVLSGNGLIAGLLNDSNLHTLSLSSDVPVNHYRLISLPTEWQAITVASGVVAEYNQRGYDTLTLQHMEILHACLRSGVAPDDKLAWGSVFGELKGSLYTALCDIDVCAVAIEVLQVLFASLDPEEVKRTLGLFGGSLNNLFPDGDDVCKGAVAGFLTDVLKMHADFRDVLSASLSDGVKASPQLAGIV